MGTLVLWTVWDSFDLLFKSKSQACQFLLNSDSALEKASDYL